MKRTWLYAIGGFILGVLAAVPVQHIVRAWMSEAISLGSFYSGIDSYEKGNQREAIRKLNQSLLIAPRRHEAHFYLGLAYEAVERDRSALEEYQEALELNTAQDISSRLQRAQTLVKMGDIRLRERSHRQAVDLYESAIRAYPEWPDIYPALAKAYEELGQRDRSVENLREYLRLETRTEKEAVRRQAEESLRRLEHQR
jgi:tetratricopeptide (TPR) repeat protein